MPGNSWQKLVFYNRYVCVCLFQRIELSAEMIMFSFKMKILIGPWNIFFVFGEGTTTLLKEIANILNVATQLTVLLIFFSLLQVWKNLFFKNYNWKWESFLCPYHGPLDASRGIAISMFIKLLDIKWSLFPIFLLSSKRMFWVKDLFVAFSKLLNWKLMNTAICLNFWDIHSDTYINFFININI